MIVAKGASPNELMDEMQTALDELSRDVDIYANQLKAFVEADNDYKELFAKTYLEVKASADKQTVGEIEARVTDRVKDFKRRADIAEAFVRATREHMDLERKKIEVYQSILAFVREELEKTLNQEPPMIREKGWPA